MMLRRVFIYFSISTLLMLEMSMYIHVYTSIIIYNYGVYINRTYIRRALLAQLLTLEGIKNVRCFYFAPPSCQRFISHFIGELMPAVRACLSVLQTLLSTLLPTNISQSPAEFVMLLSPQRVIRSIH